MERELIYHYCPLESLLHIVRSKTIWLSQIHYLNDAQEHRWWRGQVAAALGELAGNSPETTPQQWRFKRLCAMTNNPGLMNSYCGCFSQNGDSLSQWRAYADNGTGVSIGFDRDYFQTLADEDRGEGCFALDDVKYGASAKQYLEESLERDVLAPLDENSLRADWRRIWRDGVFYKNLPFKEELEVRFSYFGPMVSGETPVVPTGLGQQDFHISNGRIVPHVSVSLQLHDRKTAIQEIVLGPRTHLTDEDLRRPIRTMIVQAGFEFDFSQIELSAASYR